VSRTSIRSNAPQRSSTTSVLDRLGGVEWMDIDTQRGFLGLMAAGNLASEAMDV
jgi:hypothetical protein